MTDVKVGGNNLMKQLLGLFGITFSASPALAAWEVNMPRGVTELSNEIYELHMLIFWVCVWIAVAVFGAMIYALIKHRKSVGAVPKTDMVHSTKAELIWTAIPVIILIAMAIPAAETLVKIEDTRNPDIAIKVTGYQWKWHYEYLDQGISFYSNLAAESNAARQKDSGIDPFTVENYLLDVDKSIVVPVGAKVRILLTSNDVLHAWWVPDFAVKKDAIPGFINELWFKADEVGTYRGQCAELCGKDHGFMPIVVEVVEPEQFQQWVASNSTEGPEAALAQAN
ncbi:MAG: cytochrome c oxidase subunit II [Pseudomonadota bacterium]